MNTLAQVLCSRHSLAVMASTIMMSFFAVEVTTAQSQPSCFMIDNLGQVVNLANICDVKPQRQLQSSATTEIDNSLNTAFTTERTEIPYPPIERVYLIGNGSIPFTLGTSTTTYYSGDRPVYVRRYPETQRFSTRNNARETLFGSEANTRRVNVFDPTPFIIYRYQK